MWYRGQKAMHAEPCRELEPLSPSVGTLSFDKPISDLT
jgi:hypothetical protein